MLYRIIIFFVKIFYTVLFFPKVHGRNNLPKSGGYILASNHFSNWDAPLVIVYSPGKQLILAKVELFKNWFFSWFLKAVGAYPIRRGTADTAPIKAALSQLKTGKSVMLFPQGHRQENIDVESAKDGVALLATRAKVPVIPVGIKGEYKIFRRMMLCFGEPIYFDNYYGRKLSSTELGEVSSVVLSEIIKLID